MPWNQFNVDFRHGMIFFVLRNFIKFCFGLSLAKLKVFFNDVCFHGREWNGVLYLGRRAQIRWNMELVERLKNIWCWGNHWVFVGSFFGWKKTLFGGGFGHDRIIHHDRLNFGTLPFSHFCLHASKYLRNILYKINPTLPQWVLKNAHPRCFRDCLTQIHSLFILFCLCECLDIN